MQDTIQVFNLTQIEYFCQEADETGHQPGLTTNFIVLATCGKLDSESFEIQFQETVILHTQLQVTHTCTSTTYQVPALNSQPITHYYRQNTSLLWWCTTDVQDTSLLWWCMTDLQDTSLL